MKFKSKKLFALVLALALVFSSVAIAVSATNPKPYIKLSTIANVSVGSANQTLTVSLSPDTKLDHVDSLILTYDSTKFAYVSAVKAADISGEAKIVEPGIISFTSSAAIDNEGSDNELVLFTISFTFAPSANGAVIFSLAHSGEGEFAAYVGGNKLDAGSFIGELNAENKVEEVYNDLVGAGLNNFIKNANKAAPFTKAKVVVSVNPCADSQLKTVADFEIILTKDNKPAVQGQNIMSADDMKAFIASQSETVLGAINGVEGNNFTMADFAVDTSAITFNGNPITAAAKYVWSTDENSSENVYKVTLNQLQKTNATIRCVFRTAMDPDYYHGSNIPDFNSISFEAYAGDLIYTKDTVIAYVQEIVDLYNEFGGDLDTNDDGVDDLSVDGVMLNQWIVDNSGGKYNLGDFVLNKTYASFNGYSIKDGMTYSYNASENVYNVYFDQVNVPEEVLMAVADNLGKIDFSQFADFNVLVINQTIGAFKAFTDSLVQAKWPTAKDVEGENKDADKSTSPSTGEGSFVGGAIIVALAVSVTAVAIIRKKED